MIIAILNIIGGIIMVIARISLVTVGALLPMMPMSGAGMSSALVGAGSAAIGAIVLALGIASVVVAYGLLKGLGWAWTLTWSFQLQALC